MAKLKTAYLIFGLILYIGINIVSYTVSYFEGNLLVKIGFSLLSLLILMIDYAIILRSDKIFKRPFENLTIDLKIILYLGIIIIPFISIYQT